LRSSNWDGVTLLDWRVLFSLFGIVTLLTLLVSIAPILGLNHVAIGAGSRQLVARATPSQRLVGATQIALAGLFCGAGFAFIWFLGSLILRDPGYEIENRFAVLFTPSFFESTPRPRVMTMVDATRQSEIIDGIPGVNAVTLTSLVPAWLEELPMRRVRDPNDTARIIEIGFGVIDAHFTEVLGLRLLYGRTPNENDIGVSLVNRSLAQDLFGRDNVVGEILEISPDGSARSEIVGVLEDLSFVHPTAEVEPMLFSLGPQSFIARAVIDGTLTSEDLRNQMQGLYESGSLSIGTPSVVRPLSDLRDVAIAQDKKRGVLTIIVASLVVALAGFGFYGTQTYLVAAGKIEYAIRASLGAGPRRVSRLVFLRGLEIGLPGLLLGALFAFYAVAWLRDDFLSREISPGMVAIAVAVSLALLILLASAAPARRVRRMQPAPLLREEQ
jgi:ABC-type antimicrobial peptide transport system permease subunit